MGEHKRNPRVALAEKGDLPEQIMKEVDSIIKERCPEKLIRKYNLLPTREDE